MLPKYVVREYDGDECIYESNPMRLEDACKMARKRATDWNLSTKNGRTWSRNYCPIKICVEENKPYNM